MKKTRENYSLSYSRGPLKRQAILDALTRATIVEPPSSGLPGDHNDVINDCYILTLDEMAALVNGDIQTIESWVSNLDSRHATWLLRWLIKERL